MRALRRAVKTVSRNITECWQEFLAKWYTVVVCSVNLYIWISKYQLSTTQRSNSNGRHYYNDSEKVGRVRSERF